VGGSDRRRIPELVEIDERLVLTTDPFREDLNAVWAGPRAAVFSNEDMEEDDDDEEEEETAYGLRDLQSF
jgi:hypothetical protein